MPTISADINSVDTLQIGRTPDAFPGGELLLQPAGKEVSVQVNADVWHTSTLNTGLAAFCLVLLILFLRRIAAVLPPIFEGLFRWKKLVNMEDNMRLSRERDSVATICVPVTMMCVSRLDMIHASFLADLTPGMKTLAIIGLLSAFLAFRKMLAMIFPERKFRHDTCRFGNKAGYDFLILLAICYLVLILLCSFSASWMAFAHKASYYVTGFLWGVYLIRKMQIMDTTDGQFTAFLYLCTVEIIPAGLLVASIVYL